MNGRLTYTGGQEQMRFIKKFLLIMIPVYFLMALYYYVSGYKGNVPEYSLYGMFFAGVFYSVMIVLSFNGMSRRNLILINTILFLLVVYAIRYMYAEFDAGVYGPSDDPYKYMNAIKLNGHLSYGVFLKKVLDTGLVGVDDMGYYSIMYFVYRIYPDESFLVNGLILLNTVLLVVSCNYVYRLQYMFAPSHFLSSLTTVLWGASPFLVLTCSNGLKEIFFTTIVIISVYYIYKYRQTKDLRALAGFFIPCFLCIFFRTAVFYLLLLTFIVSITINEKNKYAYRWALIFVILFISILVPIIIEMIFGFSFDDFMAVTNYRNETAAKGESEMAKLLPYIAAFTGPFPILDRAGGYAQMYSMAPFIKDIFAFFFIVAFVKLFKEASVKYMPMLVYILFTLVMLVTSGVTLDLRYHITYIPFFFVISVTYARKSSLWLSFYIFILFVFIYLYGTRSLKEV